jgi:hypothetical protein
MNAQRTHRITALSLAFVLTLGLLAGINQMATSPAPDTLLVAIAGAADQTIVIEAKRKAS